LQDVINTAARRWGGCELLLMDVRVQGAAAAPEIAAAIDRLARQGRALGIDAVIVTRGGGSIEDLWAFNERIVADAIFRCPLPIVAAIGHETDLTIAELVADVRCSTPTQAAMTLIPDRRTMQQQVGQLAERLARVLRNRAQSERQQLDALARHAMFRRPERMVDPLRERFSRLQGRLDAALPRRLKEGTEQLAALTRQLHAVGPMNVLQRGYSYTLGPDGKVLRSAAQVAPGQRITSVLAEGTLASEVVEPASPSPRRSTRPESRRRTSNGPGLFGE
jgi:exodeoxyribonuclease VII large subunit